MGENIVQKLERSSESKEEGGTCFRRCSAASPPIKTKIAEIGGKGDKETK